MIQLVYTDCIIGFLKRSMLMRKVVGLRYRELKAILEDRRAELEAQVGRKLRDVRAFGSERRNSRTATELLESVEADVQEDIELTLTQLKSETLSRVNEALSRLEEGTYGNCFECGDEITEKRLRALPFAACCKDCEEAKEVAKVRERNRLRNRQFGDFALFD